MSDFEIINLILKAIEINLQILTLITTLIFGILGIIKNITPKNNRRKEHKKITTSLFWTA